jgi:MscS family membrane protein
MKDLICKNHCVRRGGRLNQLGARYFTAILLILILPLGIARADSPLAAAKLASPYDTFSNYFDAMNDYVRGVETRNSSLKNRVHDAARCFNLEDTPAILRKDKGTESAIYLKEVLDRIMVVKLADIPKTVEGNTWRLDGTEIVLTKVEGGDRDGEWLFSKDTTYRLPEFYQEIKEKPFVKGAGKGAFYKAAWTETQIPSWAREEFFLMPIWQWLALFVGILLGLVLKAGVQFSIRFFKNTTWRYETNFKRMTLDALEKPMGLLAATFFWLFAIYLLNYQGEALIILQSVIKILLGLCMIWGAYKLTYVFDEYLRRLASKTENTLDDQLFPMIAKSVRVFTVIFGFLLFFQNLGFNVMSVLAGLGLGGLALALAAQDSAANLFGSLMILIDRPFKVGDWVKTGSIEGLVEEIGFRSTRVRTFYNSLVSIPNSVLAKENIDNMGERPFRRIKIHLGVTYDTPPAKIEAFMEGIKQILLANTYVKKDNFNISLDAFGDFALQILLVFHLILPDTETEQAQKHNVFIEIIRLAQDLGVAFAFPTQSIYVESTPEKPKVFNANFIEADLSSIAKDYGPDGKRSKPRGSGLFKR